MNETVTSTKKGSAKKYKTLIKKGKLPAQENTTLIRKNRKNRGLLYFGNIPHGFYEDQMMEYFAQFGKVTRLRLCRSKKTGRSKGYAYIEYLVPDVAKVVAETMNGYLMYKRLLKARYIPPEEQRLNYFPVKPITATDYPRKRKREENKKRTNSTVTKEQELKYINRIMKHIKLTKTQLKKYGISYNFKPVDIPDGLTFKKIT